MQFKYFRGPEEDMSDLVDGAVACSICGAEDRCFELDYSITNEFDDEEKEGKVGCINCLKAGLFEFWHDTEFGFLDESGLSKVYSHNMSAPPVISPLILEELKRTPRIITWQQTPWLTHCGDFMIYKGTWEPKDFYNNSSDGDGRKLFMDMTSEYQNLWDDSLSEGEAVLDEWYATYYVFECAHCGKLRGNWDCD